MAVELNITHKTTKAPNDILYAGDWNDKHYGTITGGSSPEYLSHWWPVEYSSIVQGTWEFHNAIAGNLGCDWRNSSHTLNDEIKYKFANKIGSYNLYLYSWPDADHGIATISIDGTSQGTYDQYSSYTKWNNIDHIAISILTDGTHTLDFKVTGKNASSSNYYFDYSYIWITD